LKKAARAGRSVVPKRTAPAPAAKRRRAAAPDREETILVLQGGGALGAYQAGVYECLAAMGHTPEWIMASGALPPGFPPIEIDGEHVWDGGLVSNTPLQHVLDQPSHRDRLVFQVDLFAARGEMPATLAEASEREKDIRYSSRVRLE